MIHEKGLEGMARHGRNYIKRSIGRVLAAGLMAALLGFYHSPAKAENGVPPDALAAINAALHQADAKAMSAAVIDSIASHPEALEQIVIAAARAAPAYSLGISLDASNAFPGFASRIAAAATSVTPEIAGTATAIAETRVGAPETNSLPPPAPSEFDRKVSQDFLSDFEISLGIGPALQPVYEGDDTYEVTAMPLIDITWRDRLFLAWQGSFGEHLQRGFGAKLLKGRKFSAGPYLTYDFGREASDSTHLTGIGDVKGAVEAGVFGEWYSGRYRFSIDYKQSISGEEGHNGSLLIFAAGAGERITDTLSVALSGWATYASENYMIAYYGVSAAQAAASTHTRFNPDTGFKDFAGDVTFRFDWDANWHSQFTAQWKRLLGDAEASPLSVEDSENQLFLGSTIGYQF
ncbi:MAG: MipA/OmpV family protein [Rhodospirillaceae bacterium]|nr:MipA/OmpV family protein [Rhodospirillaceae bacterium]MBT3927177.1 MipA/OmpV family protein [Rhodospirillaceae bacterium]MBT4428019.1 MipA/OmpV family protein [Rhodospirillaceae bacterium]MBT5676358.1 MipA/OmpV family protein [Rhodospirillaceae bacterium]MBT5778154.1 MipA/OmpV family protein [Rhodospirillaceae bacterium]